MLSRYLARGFAGHRARFYRRPLATSVLLISGSLFYLNAQSNDSNEDRRPAKTPVSRLIRSYLVYTMCSVPVLVDSAPSILNSLLAIPGIKQITESIVRGTFFSQFVGGESAHETIPVLRQLRREHRGAMLSHSVEVDLADATGIASESISTPSYKRNVQESINAINAAADFEDEIQRESFLTGHTYLRRTTVAIKLTAMVPSPGTLTRFSAYLTRHRPSPQGPFPGFAHPADLEILSGTSLPGGDLTAYDLCALRELRNDLRRLCTVAQERKVKVMIDAEYTWFQPAIDAFAISLMREFNVTSERAEAPLPLIYSTFQAYLRRTPSFLAKALADAKEEGYCLGVKLVRGAYHPFEVEHHRKQLDDSQTPPEPPVWLEKGETDATYDHCARLIIDNVAIGLKQGRSHVGVLFGTHNWASATLILQLLVDKDLAIPSRHHDGGLKIKVTENVVGQVYIAQLYGMCEGLTQYLVNHVDSFTPMVIKCIPYGILSEVMPYLGRRAIENKSVLGGPGGATDERRRVGRELWSRFWD